MAPPVGRAQLLRATATWLIESGAWPLRLHPKQKRPIGNAWGTHRADPVEFTEHDNIGIKVGESSSLVDIDLDCEETRALAARFLPATDRVHGRTGAARSHQWYHVEGESPCEQFNDPMRIGPEKDKAMLLEFRGGTATDQRQTMCPPSIHPSGEELEWDRRGTPSNVDATELLTATRRLASAALLARYWPGARHHASFALCGALARAKWSEKEIVTFVSAIASWANKDDGEPEKRREQAKDSAERLRAGGNVTGIPTLISLGVPEKVIGRVREWLALPAHAMSDNPQPDDELRARRERKQTAVAGSSHPGLGEHGGYRLTELGNACRLVDMHGNALRYVSSWGTWLVWDGKRWRRDDNGAADRAAKSVVAKIYVDIAALNMRASQAVNGGEQWSGAPIEEMQKWARTSSKSSSLKAMLKLAESEIEVAATADMFDRDPWLLNVANGTIDLRTGALRPHRQSDMITRTTRVEYDPDAECPQFLIFLRRVQPDDSVRDWLWRCLGYAITADVREQILVFFVGGGSNGKSVLLDVLLYVLGEYGLRAAPDLLLASTHERHPTELNELDGHRLTVCSEIEQGKQWAESTIKRLTGDDTLKARGMKENFRTFNATNKIIVAANTRPNVRGTDDGIWRRMRVVPWPVRIPDGSRPGETDERDTTLTDRLKSEEARGILAWLVKGCIEWQKRGLTPAPQAIERATGQYRKEQDTLGRWIEDCCEVARDNWESDAALYESYCKWCEHEENIQPWARRTWRGRVTERPGIHVGKRGPNSGIRALLGIGLRRVS